MDDFSFFVNVLPLSHTYASLGTGPLESVVAWRYTARADGAGFISFDYYASDPRSRLVDYRCTVKAFAYMQNLWAEVGLGIVEKIETIPSDDGRVLMRASGLDVVGELNYRSVRNLEVGAGTGTNFFDAMVDLAAFLPSGWAVEMADPPPTDYFYAKFGGESTLGAYIYLAEKTGTHFYREPGTRALIFSPYFLPSNVHAVKASTGINEQTCVITNLTRTVDTKGLLTRMYVTGGGSERNTSLTLAATDRTAPAGYTLNKEESYIQNDVAIAAYGLIDNPEVTFKAISPISNTTADYVAASNMLFDAALAELQRLSTVDVQETYTLAVAQCNVLLRPMQTIRVTYRDPEQNVDIDGDFYILETTWEKSGSSVLTTGLVVRTHGYWPYGEARAGADRTIAGKIFQSHPQAGPNEWWGYFKEIVGGSQTDDIAEFNFVMGRSTQAIHQVEFRFKVEQAEYIKTTYTLDDETAISDAVNTGNSTVTIDTTVATVTTTGATDIVAASVAIDTTAVTVNTSGATDIGDATGVTTSAASTNPALTDLNYLGLANATQDPGATWASPSTHYHQIGDHQHEHHHDHDIVNHTHPIDAEHGHASPAHGHTNSPHDHTIAAEHGHISPAHSHTNTAHAHTQTPHVHGLPALAETTSLARVAAIDTYAMSDLEYAVNGGAWADLSSATGAGDGFFELDITALVTDPAVPFRPAQESGNNVIEIRRKSSASSTKTAMIVAQLGVRGTIQNVSVAG